KHLICILPTGSGKTLIFWTPLIWLKDGITILISPLQSLGDQHDSAKELDALERGVYRVIITSPEMINNNPRFEELWANPSFCKRVNRVIFDEAHCISEWGDFRPDYRRLCKLIYICMNAIFLLASATMPDKVLRDVRQCM
ncbi:hypothetical protein BOTBODRAFT_79723, partial [Botryobasidium botryosum FD-172 SS1]